MGLGQWLVNVGLKKAGGFWVLGTAGSEEGQDGSPILFTIQVIKRELIKPRSQFPPGRPMQTK